MRLPRQSKAASTQYGLADEFTRSIVRIVEGSKPISNGVTGRLVVEFIVSTGGTMENLHLTRSSGHDRLDAEVLKALQKVELIVPPATASLRDRTFEITFNYK